MISPKDTKTSIIKKLKPIIELIDTNLCNLLYKTSFSKNDTGSVDFDGAINFIVTEYIDCGWDVSVNKYRSDVTLTFSEKNLINQARIGLFFYKFLSRRNYNFFRDFASATARDLRNFSAEKYPCSKKVVVRKK